MRMEIQYLDCETSFFSLKAEPDASGFVIF